MKKNDFKQKNSLLYQRLGDFVNISKKLIENRKFKENDQFVYTKKFPNKSLCL